MAGLLLCLSLQLSSLLLPPPQLLISCQDPVLKLPALPSHPLLFTLQLSPFILPGGQLLLGLLEGELQLSYLVFEGLKGSFLILSLVGLPVQLLLK